MENVESRNEQPKGRLSQYASDFHEAVSGFVYTNSHVGKLAIEARTVLQQL
jgi:hypothetical protein